MSKMTRVESDKLTTKVDNYNLDEGNIYCKIVMDCESVKQLVFSGH